MKISHWGRKHVELGTFVLTKLGRGALFCSSKLPYCLNPPLLSPSPLNLLLPQVGLFLISSYLTVQVFALSFRKGKKQRHFLYCNPNSLYKIRADHSRIGLVCVCIRWWYGQWLWRCRMKIVSFVCSTSIWGGGPESSELLEAKFMTYIHQDDGSSVIPEQ